MDMHHQVCTKDAPYQILILCETSWMVSTDAPKRVPSMFLELKHTSKGATDATLVVFLADERLYYCLKYRLLQCSEGFTVLIFVPPKPWLSIDSNAEFKGTTLSSTLIDFTPMKYSAEGSPRARAEAVFAGLMKSGMKARLSDASMLGGNT